ncbi:MAG TPA: NAD(P)-dependent oxidoreductase [Acidimicrobiales bacterium]|nr:NAD(P)-dependent oxidoreductase [Acidimicrobiales bacterium]
MSRPRVFVPQPIPEVGLARLREFSDVEVWPYMHRAISVPELGSAVARSDYLLGWPHSMPITKSMIEANPNLRGIAVHEIPNTSGANLRKDLEGVAAAREAGIAFLVPPRAPQPPEDAGGRGYPWPDYALNPRCTSDLLVGLVLNLAYRIVEADKYCRGTGYFQEQTMAFMGQGCTGKTVALWGLGKVARHAVRKFRALDMDVVYNKRTRLDKEDEEELGVEWVGETDALISMADYLCMLVNFEPSNTKLMGEREFGLMKPTAYFINVGRGRLVDEEAMVRALQDRTIAGAGLDVFWEEPPVVLAAHIPDALRKLDNVVLTPHNGGATHDSRGRGALSLANVIVDDIIRRQRAGHVAEPAALRPRPSP